MNAKERQKKITNAALLGIIVNVLIATIKIIIGLAASSIAVGQGTGSCPTFLLFLKKWDTNLSPVPFST